MKEKEQIQRWIEGSLTKEELNSFEESETFHTINKIVNSAASYKAPDYDVENELAKLQERKENESEVKTINWFTMAWRAAAILVVAVGLYLITLEDNATVVATTIGQKIEHTLPDGSTVNLNSNSQITVNEGDWSNKREIKLVGEAYFKVKKGSSFSVLSDQGKVTVLGTQFNVSDRKDVYEVVCFEGKVQVEHNEKTYILVESQAVRDLVGVIDTNAVYNEQVPEWLRNRSSFSGAPLRLVLEELQRQYDIEVVVNDIDMDQRFSGSFPHDNLELAIKAITTPFSIDSSLNDDQLILSSAK